MCVCCVCLCVRLYQSVMHRSLVGEAKQSYRNRYKRPDSVVGKKRKKKKPFYYSVQEHRHWAVSVAMATESLSIVNIDLQSKQELLGD